ncbi:MAG: type II secretion system protein GspN [Spirochaetes bacterium]|nr:type II secretion system protein GspN [Spirochaetota bacterium]
MVQLQEIIETLKRLAAWLRRILSETVRLPYAKLYFALSVLLICIFTAISYPIELQIKKEAQNLERFLAANIIIGDMDIGYIGDSSIERLDVVFRDNTEFQVHDAIMDVNVLGLMINHILKRDYTIDGSFSMKKVRYESNRFGITCAANGNIDLVLQRSPTTMKRGDLTLLLQNAVIKLPPFNMPGGITGLDIDLPVLQCSAISFEIVFDENTIRVKRAAIAGKDLKGSCSGTIQRSRVFRNSSIDLNIAVDETSAVLDNYKMLLSKYISDNKLNVKIRGTVGQPSVELAQ